MQKIEAKLLKVGLLTLKKSEEIDLANMLVCITLNSPLELLEISGEGLGNLLGSGDEAFLVFIPGFRCILDFGSS